MKLDVAQTLVDGHVPSLPGAAIPSGLRSSPALYKTALRG